MDKIYKTGSITILLAIFCNILWGSAYPGIKLGYQAFGIETVWQILLFAGIRFTVAGAILILFSSVKNKKVPLPQKKNVPMLVLLAVVYTAIQYLFFLFGTFKNERNKWLDCKFNKYVYGCNFGSFYI